MKNFTIIHILFFLLFMLLYQCARSQDYVVTTAGDTVQGELKILPFDPEKKVLVRTDTKKETYSILNIRSYYFRNETYFPKKGPHGYTFMKLVKPGFLSLYSFQSEGSTPGGYFLSKADGRGLEVPNIGFKKQMTKFLDDCGDISAQIEKGDYGRKDLEDIIDVYNTCISEKSSLVKREITEKTEAKSPVPDVPPAKAKAWDILEEKIKARDNFEEKTTALEMIADIKSRIQKGDKIPNYVVDGLKNILSSHDDLKDDLANALSEL